MKNNKKKILFVVGARPQFVKLAPLWEAFQDVYRCVMVHTGQHYDTAMSEFFFDDLNLPKPDHNLQVGSGSHARQTADMLVLLEKTFLKENPDLVMVFGDTNTTLAGALSAKKLQIPVCHIEAGLRSFNREMPEEINRVVIDHISDFLFAPTENAMKNLKKEGLGEKSFLTGDIMVDALNKNIDRALEKSKILDKLGVSREEYLLLTLHRPYNVDDAGKLRHLLYQLGGLAEKIVFPAHPRTWKMIKKENIEMASNIMMIDPVGYLDFLNLEKCAHQIITDSGGVQKEAFILKKPCVTIRHETEWIETVRDGCNILLSPNEKNIPEKIKNFEPKNKQSGVYNENVVQKMLKKMSELI